ncbi:MAG: hypothetical protein IPP47_12755 [Bryobacterales bacterium]|nr:hypothetical protein [Bryobacterales bacterium]
MGARSLWLAACFLPFPLFLPTAQGETPCWKIVRVSTASEQKNYARQYYVQVDPCYLPPTLESGFHLNGEDFDSVLRHFGARIPEELIGKWFASPAELRASRAGVSLLALVQKPRPKSVVTPQVVYDRAAAAVSRLQVPDYSDLDTIAVLAAFEKVFDCGKTLAEPRKFPGSDTVSTMGWGVNPQWFQWFCGRVSQLSRGRVLVRRIDCKQGEMGISCSGHGPQCVYEELVAVDSSGRKLRFDLGYQDTYALRPIK